MKTIDLRRDTITIPTDKMKTTAFSVALGDSIYEEDVAQKKLENLASEITGKEAAIFLPSGTMGNLIAVLSHTNPGDEVVMEENAHIFTSETGGAASIGGVSINRVSGRSGIPNPEDIEQAIRPDDIHYPGTGLICLEMSHYRYGGIVAPLDMLTEAGKVSKKHRIPAHLDGARIFNAALYLKTDVKNIVEHVDSVMFCLSKGLGAPVGSMLCGSTEFINIAKRYRKMLGGGMRQTGWLCSCGIDALQPGNITLLQEDHDNAALLAELLSSHPLIEVDPSLTHTNFVIAEFKSEKQAEELPGHLKKHSILINKAKNQKIAFVLSRQVNRSDIKKTAEAINNFVAGKF